MKTFFFPQRAAIWTLVYVCSGESGKTETAESCKMSHKIKPEPNNRKPKPKKRANAKPKAHEQQHFHRRKPVKALRAHLENPNAKNHHPALYRFHQQQSGHDAHEIQTAGCFSIDGMSVINNWCKWFKTKTTTKVQGVLHQQAASIHHQWKAYRYFQTENPAGRTVAALTDRFSAAITDKLRKLIPHTRNVQFSKCFQ